MRRTNFALVAAAAAASLSSMAIAQPDAIPAGHWSGVINEPHSQSFPQYTLSVHIDADHSGNPVGVVEYDAFPCVGAWLHSARQPSGWRFDEVIVRGVDRCSRHVVIMLTPRDGGLDVRLWSVGHESQVSTGHLRRRS